MNFSLAIAMVSGMVNLSGFAFYFLHIHKGRATPNLSSWGLWAVIQILNLLSYRLMTGDDVKTVLPLVSSVINVLTFVWAFAKRNQQASMKQLTLLEYICLTIACVSMLMWWKTKSATIANLFLQLALAMGYIPTAAEVLKDPQKEKPVSWFLWGVSYIHTAMVVVLRWKGDVQDGVYPILGLICNWGICFIALRKTTPA